MTERLYLTCSQFTLNTQVTSCQKHDDGSYAVKLASTIFHPQGGGQPSDQGWLNDIPVTHVAIINNDIEHITHKPIAIGPVSAQIDAALRQQYTRLHSGGHLISHLVEMSHWHPVKAHHWPGESRVVFQPDPQSETISVEALQARCNDYIGQDLACQIHMRDDGFRQVQLGDLAPYPCGGTHVASLGELTSLSIQSVRFKKGKLTVRYDMN